MAVPTTLVQHTNVVDSLALASVQVPPSTSSSRRHDSILQRASPLTEPPGFEFGLLEITEPSCYTACVPPAEALAQC
jgi:hypothetical protein